MFVGLVVYLSLNTNPLDAGRFEDVKVGHFIAYGWLMLWFAQLFPANRSRAIAAILLGLLGVSLEYVQGMTGYRSLAYSDMRDNVLGVLVGWVIALTALGRTLPFLESVAVRRRGPSPGAR